MTGLRFTQPSKSLFGPIFWLIVGICAFAWLLAASKPSGEAAQRIAAEGPDGFSAYFASPEASVVKINEMLAGREWVRLARYYDFRLSSVRKADVVSGAYFAGHIAVPPEGTIERPFPPGFRFLYSEPTELEDVFRVVVVGAPADPRDPSTAPQATYFLSAEPEGFRIIPADSAGRLKAATSRL